MRSMALAVLLAIHVFLMPMAMAQTSLSKAAAQLLAKKTWPPGSAMECVAQQLASGLSVKAALDACVVKLTAAKSAVDVSTSGRATLLGTSMRPAVVACSAPPSNPRGPQRADADKPVEGPNGVVPQGAAKSATRRM